MSAVIELPTSDGGSMDNGQPPQDATAEQALLGAMLLSRNAIDDVVGWIKREDFRSIHPASCHTYSSGCSVCGCSP